MTRLFFLFTILSSVALARYDFPLNYGPDVPKTAPKRTVNSSQTETVAVPATEPAPRTLMETTAESSFNFSWDSLKAKVNKYIDENWKNTESASGNQMATTTETKPTFQTPSESQVAQQRNSTEQIKKFKEVAAQIQKLQVARVIVAPVKAAKDVNLKMNGASVPVFDFVKLRAPAAVKAKVIDRVKVPTLARVPLLNLPEEAQLDVFPFKAMVIEPFSVIEVEKYELQSPHLMTLPEFAQELGPMVQPAAPVEKIDIPYLRPEQIVSTDKINKIIFKPQLTTAWTDLQIKDLASEELKLLRALILYDKKDLCHIASGLFYDLTTSQNLEVKASSEFHLGMCLHVMNLPTEAQIYLDKLIRSKHSEYTSPAIKMTLSKMKKYLEDSFVETLMTLKDDKLVPKESIDDINYLKAKYFAKRQKYEETLKFADQVNGSSDKFARAIYLKSLALHFLHKDNESIRLARHLVTDLKNRDEDKEFLALAQIHLGRVSFQEGKYKDSMEAFQQVNKDNSLWVQALTEQGWAQLQSKDASGAIGNMHSIHSPFFDGVYKPESYIVRSIGYLTICQYADAYKTLAYLDKKYTPWLDQLQSFNKNTQSSAIYDYVAQFISQKGKVASEKLPGPMVKEAAHQKDFLNSQEAINSLIDESSGYPFIQSIVEKDKRGLTNRRNQATLKISELKTKIKNQALNPGTTPKKNLTSWKTELAYNEDFINEYDFKMATYQEGEQGFKRLTPQAQARVLKIKSEFKTAAGEVLRKHFKKMASRMRYDFDNNELLKYEIFAGSGENLRYQVAGGRVVGMPRALERKLAAQNWDFDGEFWEDEIGHYRSALKNNCKREN